MSKPTFANLTPGKKVLVGGIFSDPIPCSFVKFKVFNRSFLTLSGVKKYFGVTNLRDLEKKLDKICTSIHAEFYDIEREEYWDAYLFQGSFKWGSGAYRMSLSEAN
jgi:hypothetical protein